MNSLLLYKIHIVKQCLQNLHSGAFLALPGAGRRTHAHKQNSTDAGTTQSAETKALF